MHHFMLAAAMEHRNQIRATCQTRTIANCLDSSRSLHGGGMTPASGAYLAYRG